MIMSRRPVFRRTKRKKQKFVLLSVYVIKLLIETINLVHNINDISTIVKNDMGSVMSELKISLKKIK